MISAVGALSRKNTEDASDVPFPRRRTVRSRALRSRTSAPTPARPASSAMGCVASKDARDERGATYKAGVERGSLDAPGRRRATRSDDEKAKNDDDDDDGAKTRATPPPIPPPAVDARAEKARRARAKKKRVAIAVEALASDASITKVPKDKASTKLILNAVERNILFDGLNEETRLVLASTMTRAVAAAGQDIISQGDDDASHFYVLASGAATVHVRRAREAETDDDDAGARDDDDDAGDAGDDENVSNSEKDGRDESESENANAPAADEEETRVGSYVAGDSFGELALLYSCPRAATVRATEECALWQLERRVYVNVKRSYQGACVAAAESVSRRFLFVLPCPSRLTSTLPTTSVRQSDCSAASARSWSRASSSRRSGRRTRPRSRTRCGR